MESKPYAGSELLKSYVVKALKMEDSARQLTREFFQIYSKDQAATINDPYHLTIDKENPAIEAMGKRLQKLSEKERKERVRRMHLSMEHSGFLPKLS